MALFRSEVAFTLSSHAQGQSSYPCCLPSTEAALLSVSYPQIHSHVYTHECINTCAHGLSFLLSLHLQTSVSQRHGGWLTPRLLALASLWPACLSNPPRPTLSQSLAVGGNDVSGRKAQLLCHWQGGFSVSFDLMLLVRWADATKHSSGNNLEVREMPACNFRSSIRREWPFASI